MKIELKAIEILEKQINQTAARYPPALKPKHIQKIMDCSQTQAYDALRKGLIPGAKKIEGMGWRIPRETFLAWWFGSKAKNKPLKPVQRRQNNE